MANWFPTSANVVQARFDATVRALASSWRGSALAFAELGAFLFFAAGVAGDWLGPAASWWLLIAAAIGGALRAVDLESCSLFIPGGLQGLATLAFGRRTARVADSVLLVERLFFGALIASVVGQTVAVLARTVLGAGFEASGLGTADTATALAAAAVGVVWWWQRQGRKVSGTFATRVVLAVLAVVTVVLVGGIVTALWRARAGFAGILLPSPFEFRHAWFAGLPRVPGSVRIAIESVTALGFCLFVAGSVEVFGQLAPDFPQPRIRHLRRTAWLVSLWTLVSLVGTSLVFQSLVPVESQMAWRDVPLVAIALRIAAPGPLQFLLEVIVVGTGVALLCGSLQRVMLGAQPIVDRLTAHAEAVASAFTHAFHLRLGTPVRSIDTSVIAILVILVFAAGQPAWLARAYTMGVVGLALLKTAALIRLRSVRPEPRASRIPGNVRLAGRVWPVGLYGVVLLVGVPAVCVLATGDPASLAGVACLVGTAVVMSASRRAAHEADAAAPEPGAELLSAPAFGVDHLSVRPGAVVVALRRPHFLGHLRAALEGAGDRDVVAMTVRLIGVDVADDTAPDEHPTLEEARLLAAALSVAESQGHPVHLLIVPAANVFDAVVDTVVRLRATEVCVGESETLSANDQARLLGDAWERVRKSGPLAARLVIRHTSGRTAVYHLGAHPPTLGADDLDLIHTLWLDVRRTIGPHIHHHDIVRAALTYMEEQLGTDGPLRDQALDLVRRVARPAEELAAVVHQRDFARLRDMIRNRSASDLASALTELPVEDQVVVFRVLPRKDAAATFEYLTREAQETLLKAMAQEDVASILNDMAPDERTMFLEELPASVTQQLLALLTPVERAVALTLLGYPEGSIGRLMTPDYVAVRQHWTVQEVLDYIREHGRDSETLNVIYVVDDRGVLIDDIRIREFLLTSPLTKVADLMDRRVVALGAADSQQAAVVVFRKEDRSALPVTDSAGVLIGIVTIDDVLDVVEAAATKEVQRIGGSEALNEPYMRIAFSRMIQKRAGWLAALFMGEMLTATAMGAFEHEIERAVVLALFVPLIISSGGNSGSQASTLVIRALALGEVTLKDWWRVARREIAAGLVLGGILGAIGFLRIVIWSAFWPAYGEHWLLLALTVATALVGVVLWGTLIGSLLPLVLRRLGFDPATSSAPLVATLVDVTGLIIYFSAALVILKGTLL